MPAKNLYKPKEKEKNIYSSSGAANRSNTAATGTRSTPQNNVWNAEQSTPRSQSNTVQKIKREKSPSELGEEVVRSMLEDFAKEERQKQAAADRAAQYDSGAARAKAAAGKQKTAQYGNSAGQFGGAASYSSPSAAKPAVGKQKSTPYGGAATAQYNTGTAVKAAAVPKAASYADPAAAMPTVRRHEKTSSELGDEMVARVLVEEGIMDPKYLEEYLASFEEPSVQTFTGTGGGNVMGQGANKLYSMQRSNGLHSPVQIFGGDTGSIDPLPAWQPLAAQRYSARVASDENGFEGSGDNNSAFALDEPIDPVRPTPGEQTMAAIQEYPYLGQNPNVTWAGFWLGDWVKQLRDDTHIAPGRLLSSYLHDRGENAMDMALEGAHNGMIDHARGGVNGDLEQDIQKAQLLAGWGGPYQQYADDITNTARAIQKVLPEAAEKFRKHDAAERAREIEEMYDAGGFIKLLGDVYSALRQTLPSVLISKGTDIPALGVLFQGLSAGGNASTEVRAGGADEDTAYVYGNFVNLVEMGTELLSGGIPGLPKGLLDNALANVAETNMGRLALKAAKDALGEGAEEFISTMAEAYLAKLWNGDERSAWQTFKETFPDALYAAFQGAMVSTIMNAPSNISNIQYARALDAAIDVINNGGTVTDAQMAAANAALQYLTNSWGEDSKWSRAANQQWENARNRNFENFFPPNFIPLPMFKNSDTAQENNVPTDSANSNAEQNPNLQAEEGAKNESSQETPKFSTEKTYIDDNPATHTEEQMRRIEEYKQAVDPEIIDFIELVRESPANKRNLPLGRVTSQQAQRIMDITGIDVNDFTHIMRPNTIRHIDKRHGVFGEADHSMANNEDIARIRYVIENADSIDLVYKNGKQVFSWEIRNSDNTPAPLIQYSKALDGVCYVIQAVADSKAKKLRIVSAYIGPKQSVPPDEASA